MALAVLLCTLLLLVVHAQPTCPPLQPTYNLATQVDDAPAICASNGLKVRHQQALWHTAQTDRAARCAACSPRSTTQTTACWS
jgi:hypothetical protein